ncbi:DUF1854 domain-containing protein [Paenibacillus sp. OSY-SE]|uniref:DUF1854 domain-containing protein n=1 Tax=Paenibacillus sp. OSY-SE TaxID=1196323 RepID=UPI00037F3784|nr:DUF1854 domain-containing protein [Paenibacillus sp. OSY-SE]
MPELHLCEKNTESSDAFPPSSAPMEDIRYLSKNVFFCHTDGGVLQLTDHDSIISEIQLYRTFPFSHAERYLSVRNSDGNEIGIIPDITQLDEDSQIAIRLELKRRYFVPEVEQIHSIREKDNIWVWELTTDRGALRVEFENLHEHVQPSPEGRMILQVMFGRRCLVPPLSKLDAASRRWLKRLF